MNKSKGFSLLELIVVVIMLGVIAMILAPILDPNRSSSDGNYCPVIIGDNEYITTPEHCEALRLYIESTVAE